MQRGIDSRIVVGDCLSRVSIAVFGGTILAGYWGPAGELRRELREDRFCSPVRIGTGLLTWPQRSMAA